MIQMREAALEHAPITGTPSGVRGSLLRSACSCLGGLGRGDLEGRDFIGVVLEAQGAEHSLKARRHEAEGLSSEDLFEAGACDGVVCRLEVTRGLELRALECQDLQCTSRLCQSLWRSV